ncbi:MAG: hypothetical protein IPO22_13830 [Anaerolineales bacterium]|nr:hypothetical protein [Anaerolineales bacterium]
MFEDVKRDRETRNDRPLSPARLGHAEGCAGSIFKSDILFMPSFSEGLPVVGVQALAKGLAIVSAASAASSIWWIMKERLPDRSAGCGGIFPKPARAYLNPELLLQFRNASIEKSRNFDIQKWRININPFSKVWWIKNPLKEYSCSATIARNPPPRIST